MMKTKYESKVINLRPLFLYICTNMVFSMMKLTHKAALLLPLIFITLFGFSQTFSEHRSVPAYADINEVNSEITLKFEGDANTTSFKIYKRNLGSSSWGTPITIITGGAGNFTYKDTDVEKGKVYEYSIEKVTTLAEPFSSSGARLSGYGYVSAAIMKAPVHTRGYMLVLIATNVNDSLGNEIDQLKQDLAGDGWDVDTEIINESASVADVKSVIDAANSKGKCDAVYLLGHIPVPYSGTYCKDPQYRYPPDGHGETDANSHCGAWVADVYYGVIGGSWTDTDSTSLAKREENKNAIGDGKFDNNRIPGTATIAVGRVDFNSMPAFSETEIQLTKRYLNKAHQFKTSSFTGLRKGIIENNFAAFQEGFSSAAVRDFTAHFGNGNAITADMFTSSAANDYLFGYTCGAGSYTSCNGLGRTTDFTTKNGTMFNQIFGSFFGDYDINNNFMRASIATEKHGLVCVWSGRPKWVTHTLAIGETYGDCALRTQNNWQQYDANFYQNSPHIALLGDPSLRTESILPAQNISLAANSDSSTATINWTATNESDIEGYYVYRSHKPYGGYQVLNTTPVSGLTFTDNAPWDGTNHYMVRTAKKTITSSGSYINLSIGVSAEINGMKGDYASSTSLAKSNFKIYPTAAESFLTLEKEDSQPQQLVIKNTQGQTITSKTVRNAVNQLDVSRFASGSYFVTLGNRTLKFIKL